MDDGLTYSLEARTRVALSASAAQASSAAASLVPTYGEYGCPRGDLAALATELADRATETLTFAIVCERQRGTTWAQIAEALDDDVSAVRERYEDAVTRLQQRLVEAWLDPARTAGLPEGADDPGENAARLDEWLTSGSLVDDAFRHHPDSEIRTHPVSVGLAVMSLAEHRELLVSAARLIAGDTAGDTTGDTTGDTADDATGDTAGDTDMSGADGVTADGAAGDAERTRRVRIGLHRRRIALLEWLLAEELHDPTVAGDFDHSALRTLLRDARRRLARL